MIILSILGYILIIIGTIFLFLGSLGLIRMPDVYNRLQAGTKATTLGALSTIIGVGLVEPAWFWKTLIIAVFIVLTNPIGSHTIARASRKSGIKTTTETTIDKYEENVLNNESGDENDLAL
ncbi:MAG: monovalent cation/H(+) antiporter subunit G [Bacillota bacterium]